MKGDAQTHMPSDPSPLPDTCVLMQQQNLYCYPSISNVPCGFGLRFVCVTLVMTLANVTLLNVLGKLP